MAPRIANLSVVAALLLGLSLAVPGPVRGQSTSGAGTVRRTADDLTRRPSVDQ